MTPTPESPLITLIERLEDEAANSVRSMGHALGSRDANDSGSAVCAVWNLGSEAKRLARIVEDIRRTASRA